MGDGLKKDNMFIYGTAWKKERTAELVRLALHCGFRAVDTANQPKHYHEAGVGEGLKDFLSREKRESLFVQTKFTSVDGQDSRIPYDAAADLTTQVSQSFKSSLEHLGVSYLDSYLLHGPYDHPGLGEEDWQVWSALSDIYKSHGAKKIGISNVNIHQLKMLVEGAEIPPMVVQNRCYANRGWDREVREYCRSRQIQYQGFSLLTANPQTVFGEKVLALSYQFHCAPEQVIFKFAELVGITPLTGTSQESHMKLDLASKDIRLTDQEAAAILEGTG